MDDDLHRKNDARHAHKSVGCSHLEFRKESVPLTSLKRSALLLVFLAPSLGFMTAPANAQETFLSRWQQRASATQALQPKWIVPVVAPYPTLIQVFRSEFTRQITPAGVHNWNLGTSRGLNLIPFARTEVDVFVPPYFEHGDKTPDGFGDLSFSAKYRLASGNEQHGNYSAAVALVATVPTGSYKNGSVDASLNPYLALGKGFGKVDFVSGVGGTLPTGDTKTLGRTLVTNSYAQYHVAKYLWPELELNTTTWYGSSRDGKVQSFLTPGLMTGRYALHPQNKARRTGAVLGFGFQTAVTQYRTYNHSLIFTGRFLF